MTNPDAADRMPSSTERPSFLKRYTNVLSLLDILQHRHVVLTNTAQWRDVNDQLVLDEYRRRVGAAGVFAMCMTGGGETFHHWEIFGGPTGVCITFDAADLTASLPADIACREMNYTQLPDLQRQTVIAAEDLPFIKRWGFRDEKEVRIVGTSTDPTCLSMPVGIDLAAIREITFSPFIAAPLVKSARTLLETVILKDVPMRPGLKIGQSLLTTNKQWLAAIQRLGSS